MPTSSLPFTSHSPSFSYPLPSRGYQHLFLFGCSTGASSNCFRSNSQSLNFSKKPSFVALQYPSSLVCTLSYHPCRSFTICVSLLGKRSILTQLGGIPSPAKVKCKATLSRQRMNVRNSVADWRAGSSVKVVGLGTRATSAVQFCYESSVLASSEFWIPCGNAVNMQSFELLNRANVEMMDGCTLDGAARAGDIPTVVVLVIGIGAGMSGKVALDILQASRDHGSLSVMIVIQPFNFEGMRRKQEIEDLTTGLLEYTDLSFVLEHEALLRREKVTLAEALRLADSTSLFAIKAVSDLCLGDQDTVFDAPSEGLREILSSEVLPMFGHAGVAWVGFGSSYTVKTAVQRAAFESPFLQGLVPGVKGLVACTIASAECKERKDLQAAVHTLRCIVGPMAHLVCTSVKEPSLRRAVVLATIFTTRIDTGGWHESPKQSVMFPELFPPISRVPGGINQHADGMVNSELRKSASESCIEDEDKLPEANHFDNENLGSLFVENLALQSDLQDNMDENALEGDNPARCLENTDQSQPDSCEENSTTHSSEEFRPSEMVTHFPTESEESSSVNGSEDMLTIELTGNEDIKSLRSQESASGIVQDQPGTNERLGFPSNSEKSFSDKGNDISKWKIPGFPSMLDWGKTNMTVQKEGFNGWESGPNSAAAEAWAQTRQQLQNFGMSSKTNFSNVPMGVKPTNVETASHMLGKQPFDPALPLSRVVSSGLEAVADLYNTASSKVLKRSENEGGKQGSSVLSQRAASMLETERSSGKLTPMVEMNYKNGIYKGRCARGLPEGKGRLTYADGSFYDGLWKQGKRAGAGSFYYANGDVFQGYWRDDQMHGKGWFYFHTGDRLYSDFWKGKANGEGRFYSAKGDVFFGHFQENWRHGKCLSIDINGIRWCEIWDSGVMLSRTQLEVTE